MKTEVRGTIEEAALAAAEAIIAHIHATPNALLCLAGGDTPLPVYRALIAAHKAGRVDLHSVRYVALDEWVGLGYEDMGSCKQMMFDNFYLPAEIPADHVTFFDGRAADINAEAIRVANSIDACGGISLTLLGIGMNGHIGFNEPNRKSEATVAVYDLDETTVNVGRKYFGGSTAPGKGITVTITALSRADTVIYIATGAHKHDICKRILSSEPTPAIPATMMKGHQNITLYADTSVQIAD